MRIVLKKPHGSANAIRRSWPRMTFQAITICGAGKLRAPSPHWHWKCRKGLFEGYPDGLLLFVRPFETALLFEALFDFRGFDFCFASYCSIRLASVRSAVRNCSKCLISRSIFLKLSRRARIVPRKNSSWMRRRQSAIVNMQWPHLYSPPRLDSTSVRM